MHGLAFRARVRIWNTTSALILVVATHRSVLDAALDNLVGSRIHAYVSGAVNGAVGHDRLAEQSRGRLRCFVGVDYILRRHGSCLHIESTSEHNLTMA